MDQLKLFGVITFFVFVAAELVISVRKQWKLYHTPDTLNNLLTGTLTAITRGFIKAGVLAAFSWGHQYALLDIPVTWWSVIILLFANDFMFYWYHRVGHESRFFWASHVVHHNSERMNISTSMRGNFVHFFYRFLFWIPLAMLGFEPWLILLIDQISFFYQLWLHTETIGKLHPAFEYVMNTPSHHRVHHGSNPQYIDKNYAAVFIIWDRMFGTFAPEQEKVKYGITKNINTYNPFMVLFHEFVALAKDVRKPGPWRQRWQYMFGKPGWAPEPAATKLATTNATASATAPVTASAIEVEAAAKAAQQRDGAQTAASVTTAVAPDTPVTASANGTAAPANGQPGNGVTAEQKANTRQKEPVPVG